MYCENCGSKIPEGSDFCTECGKQLSMPGPIEGRRDVFEEAPETIPEEHKTKERSVVTIIATLAVLVFIAVIIAKIFRPQAPVKKAVNALVTTLTSGTEYEVSIKDDGDKTSVKGFINFNKDDQCIEMSETEDKDNKNYKKVTATLIESESVGVANVRKYKSGDREDRGSGSKQELEDELDMKAIFKLVNELKKKDVTKVNYDKLIKDINEDLYDEISDVIEPKNINKAIAAAIKSVEKNDDCIKVEKNGKTYTYEIDVEETADAILDAVEDYIEDDDAIKILKKAIKKLDNEFEVEVEFDGKYVKDIKFKFDEAPTVKIEFSNTGKCSENIKETVKEYMKKPVDGDENLEFDFE